MARPPRRASHRVLTFILVLATLALAAIVLRSGLSAQAAPPAIATDKGSYLAGETVGILGIGFGANEAVTLRVTHPDGTAEAAGGHEGFTAVADAAGSLSATWPLGRDPIGNDFVVSVARAVNDPPLTPAAPVDFRRVASIWTNKYDYQPGETALIGGAGFNPGEEVILHVTHANGLNDGNGHLPFPVIADEQGGIASPWLVDPDDSEGAIFRITATATPRSATPPGSGLVATSTFTDLLITIVDDAGADDEPNQKDLNFMQVDYSPATPDLAVNWGWDDTSTTGNNTRDAGALFDTDADGFANFSLYVTVATNGTWVTQLYVCGADNRSDRCANPTLDTTFLSTATVATVANTDPFGTPTLPGGASNPNYDPDHVTGNTCDTRTACYTSDTIATVTVKLADVGGGSAKLLNVCSYPSGEPNSDPSDCVVNPDNGFLTIVKTASPNDSTGFTFNLGAGQAAEDGTTSWTINGSGSVQLISIPTGTSYDLTEAIPAGWKLTNVSCAIQTSPTTATGTNAAVPVLSGDAGVTDFEIRLGLETICTFTDAKQAGSIQVVKNTVGGIAGQNYDFVFTPSGFNSGNTFTLTTTGENGTNSSSIFSSLPTNGTYTVAETTSPTGWNQTSAECKIGTEVVSGPATAITVRDGQTTICTFTNTEDQNVTRGNLKIAKVFDPLTSGFTGSFSIPYDCDDGTAHDGTATLEAGEDTTITGIPPGTSCTVTEPNLPTAPAGWTFGPPSIVGSPASITAGTTSTVTVTNTISRDTGSLRIVKSFDPLTSGFNSTFAINYDCDDGATHDGTANLAAGGETTIGGIPTGTSCTVTEPTLPTAPTGWTFGNPSVATSPQVITAKDTTYTVTVTNTITRDQGYLKISKVFDPLTSGFAGTFAINYVCDQGGPSGTVNLAAGGSETIGPINTGIRCAVREPNLPTAPTGWTFGTPSVTGNPATIVKGDQTAAVVVSVTNTITRDQGYLKISKVFAPLTSGFAGTFAINYVCDQGGPSGTVNLAAGGSETIGPINTGIRCAVREPNLPTAPTGWTFGTPSVSGNPATIVKGDQTAAVTVTVTNTITRDQGYLKISKVFNPLTSGFAGTFAINYVCIDGPSGTVNLAAGASQTIGPINTGIQCAVREPNLPTAPTGWTFGTPSVSGNPATIVKGDQTAAVVVTVTNSITRNVGSLTISKVVNGAPEGFTGTFGYAVVCLGDSGSYTGTIAYPTPGFVTISGIPTGNQCGVRETSLSAPPTGYTWGTASVTGNPATIAVTPTATVTITNTVTGRAKVIKTVQGVAPSGTQAFTFQLRQGASTTQNGTTLETLVANAGNGGILNFTTVLTPGSVYQLCEIVMPAWSTSLGTFVPGSFNPPDGVVPNPNVDNSILCGNFTAAAGVTTEFTIDNTPPPGGRALTIGFWKNWASCSSGRQASELDRKLAMGTVIGDTTDGHASLPGIVISAYTAGSSLTFPAFGPAFWLVLHGSTATPDASPDCLKATRILDKSRIDNGKKMASDPAFNLAAQLLAAELNYVAGAGRTPAATSAINEAVQLLGKYRFNGITHQNISAADAARMNYLATVLDNYNNNRP